MICLWEAKLFTKSHHFVYVMEMQPLWVHANNVKIAILKNNLKFDFQTLSLLSNTRHNKHIKISYTSSTRQDNAALPLVMVRKSNSCDFPFLKRKII